MGLPGPTLDPKDSFFAVEFDTSFDPSLGDINDNHIGIDVKTVMSFAAVDAISKGIDLKSGKKITAWIEYKDALKLVRVWVSYSRVRPENPVLAAEIDLSNQFKEFMHVGFSASNGRGSAMHIVDHWRFKTFTSYPSVNPIDMIEDGGCLMCYPHDSGYMSNFINDENREKEKIKEMVIHLGGIIAFLLFLFALIATMISCCLRSKKKKSDVDTTRRSKGTQEKRACGVPRKLSLSEIKSATMGFNRNRIVGEGASATVYRGNLSSGGAVAVKRFDKTAKYQNEFARNPFSTEFATMVGCLRHKNLVQLRGWCCEGTELVLVYEYLPNGSLDNILHNRNLNSSAVLSWDKRVNIILGVASALTYLHEECERQIIHRDVKSCNIMLDADFTAKLGDFGLAEVYDEHSCANRESTIPAGTMGYLAPEYVYSGVPTEKTDVYSFGVVVLEVATGKRPVESDGTAIVEFAWKMWERGKLVEAADLRLGRRFDAMEMERMLIVGLACVHPNHERRPSVKEAAMIIRGEAPLPLLPSRKPAVNIRSVVLQESYSKMIEGDQSPGFEESIMWLTPRSQFG